jgi:hypothetical protein
LEHQSIYYSSWHFAAVHIALTIPSLRTIGSLMEALRIPKKRLEEVLEFLCLAKLVIEKNGSFIVLDKHIRIGQSSHNIIKHHTHWRQQAIESLERETANDLHYSSVISLSEADLKEVKEKILQFIQEFLQKIKSSSEEQLYGFSIDFFDLRRP